MEEEILYSVKVEGIVTLENLTKANKALREERKNVDLQSVEGQKRVKEINETLDKNTQKIKENVSALEKQKINIGNYKSALDGMVPGFGKLSAGIEGTTTASKAFIATPIGAVIGLLGLAIAALTSYFRDNEEGQNKFNKIMNIGSAIVGKFTDLLSYLGGFIFDNLAKGFEAVIGFLSEWVPGFDEATKAVEKFLNLDRADFISNLQAETDLLERQLIVQKARLEAIVAENKLRAEDKSLDLKTRLAALDEAKRSQEELNALELKYAENKLKIIQETNKQSNSNKEALKAEAEATAELDKIRKDAADKQKEIFTKGQDLRNQQKIQTDLYNAAIAEELRLKDNLAIVNERLAEQAGAEIPALDIKISKTADLNKAMDNLIKKNEESIKKEKENAKVAQDSKDQQLKAAVSLSAAVIGLGKADNAAKKFLGLTTIGINSGIGVSEAIKAGAGKPWPLNLAAILSGITAVLGGISQAKGLLGFAYGGLTGTRIMSHHGTPINRSNGDNLLATVKTGEVILNERQQAALGGDRTFANIGVPGFASGGFVSSTARQSESSLNFNQMLQAFTQVPIVVTVEDINLGQNRVGDIVNRARVI